jgi:general secretion pathway protein B
MSSILDALRKSERARRLGRAPVYRAAATPAAPPLLRGLSLAAGVALLVTLALLAWLLQRPEPGSPPVPVSGIEAPGATAPARVRSESPDARGAAPKSMSATVWGPPEANPSVDVSRTVPVTKPPRPPASPAATGEAPWLSSLPDSFRRALPPLTVNIHVYAADAAQRILYINNQPCQRGQEIGSGVMVEDIVPDGVVLRYQGQRFKLPRPS